MQIKEVHLRVNEMEKILNNTENIIQYLNSLYDQGGWTVWIPVIAAAVTATVALLGILHSKKNIRMNARIEWIQKVRETAAGAISLCYSLIYETDEKNAKNILLAAQEKINLLILYFGPGASEKVLEEKDNLLRKENSNEGKNNYIVNFLEEILIDIKKFYERKYSLRVRILTMEIRELNQLYPIEETGERLQDEEGNWIQVKDYPKRYYEEKKKLEEEKNELENSNQLENKIEELREILRNYLKIEWNVAKKGK